MLEEMLADHCALYNAALEERRTAWSKARISISCANQSGQLKEIRSNDPEGQGRWSFSSQQATLRRLKRTFEGFFRRVRNGQRAGYPRFRSIHRFDSVTWPADGDGCRWNPNPTDTVRRVRLQGIGHVRVHQHRVVEGQVKTITVKREGTAWFVILSCESEQPSPRPKSGRAIGIDLGVTHFATTSAGKHVPNPRHLEASAERIAEAQRELAAFPAKVPRAKWTRRHRRAAEKVAKMHRKVARQRADFAHKAALDLVRRFDVIACERLNIQGMTRRARPRPDPEWTGEFLPNGAAAKTGLNRRILDAGWRQFLTFLAYKAAWAGREIKAVNPANTSRTCPRRACGHVAAENRDGESFKCVRCGYSDHADRVGALNIAYRAGLVRFDGALPPEKEV